MNIAGNLLGGAKRLNSQAARPKIQAAEERAGTLTADRRAWYERVIQSNRYQADHTGDRAFVRADHPDYTAEQLMRHEAGHDRIAKGEIDPNEVRERIRETFGNEKAETLSEQYEEAYRGSGLSADEVWVRSSATAWPI